MQSEVRKLQSGLRRREGPLWHAQHSSLFFVGIEDRMAAKVITLAYEKANGEKMVAQAICEGMAVKESFDNHGIMEWRNVTSSCFCAAVFDLRIESP